MSRDPHSGSAIPPIANEIADELRTKAEEAIYVAVGFAVLTVQRLNVRRVEFEREHRDEVAAFERGVGTVLDRLRSVLETA